MLLSRFYLIYPIITHNSRNFTFIGSNSFNFLIILACMNQPQKTSTITLKQPWMHHNLPTNKFFYQHHRIQSTQQHMIAFLFAFQTTQLHSAIKLGTFRSMSWSFLQSSVWSHYIVESSYYFAHIYFFFAIMTLVSIVHNHGGISSHFGPSRWGVWVCSDFKLQHIIIALSQRYNTIAHVHDYILTVFPLVLHFYSSSIVFSS